MFHKICGTYLSEKVHFICLKPQLPWVFHILSGNPICTVPKHISNSQISLDRAGSIVGGTTLDPNACTL